MIKTRKVTLPILAMVSLCAFAVLYNIGFRITYAPWLEANWDAMSAVAAIASCIISTVLTIWIIGQTNRLNEKQLDTQSRLNQQQEELQKEISKRELTIQAEISKRDAKSAELQRKIDTFDKRFEIYRCTKRLLSTGNMICARLDAVSLMSTCEFIELYLFSNPEHPESYQISQKINQNKLQSQLVSSAEANQMQQQRTILLQDRLMIGINEMHSDSEPIEMSQFFFEKEVSDILKALSAAYNDIVVALLDQDERILIDKGKSSYIGKLSEVCSKIKALSILEKIEQETTIVAHQIELEQ